MLELFASLKGLVMTSELGRVIISAIIIVLFIVLYKYGTQLISANKNNSPAERIRTKLVLFKNGLFLITVASLAFIWVSQFAGIILSLAAVAGATLIVSKELIMCALGYLVITFTRPFKVGDYITVGTHSGRVIDIDMFSTTLVQIGSAHQLNGRQLNVPNNMFITCAIENATATSPYIINIYQFKLPLKTDIEVVGELARQAADTVTKEWQEDAQAHFKRIEEADFIDIPSSAPKILWESVDHREIKMSIRFACPANKRVHCEQEIFKAFWKQYYALLTENTKSKEPTE
jgi:small-conductance mechanosensitive channel